MKLLAIVMVLVATAAESRADVFGFKDIDGFQECLVLDHLIETVRTPSGSQTRVLGPEEIQLRCVAAAVKLLSKSKSVDLVMRFVAALGRHSAREHALELVGLAIDLSLAACNDLVAYEVVLRGLELGGDGFVARSKAIAKRCLADQAFRKDFIDELASSDHHVAEHACDVLLDAKLVKTCKRSQP